MIKLGQTPQNDLAFSKKRQEEIRNQGVAGAYGASSIVLAGGSVGTLGIKAGLKEFSENISKGDSVELRKAVQEGLKGTGLYDEGVRTYYVKEKSFRPVKMIKSAIENYRKEADRMFEEGPKSIVKTVENILPFKFGKGDKKAIGAFREEVLSYTFANETVDEFIRGMGLEEQNAKNFKESIMNAASKAGLIKEKLGLGTTYLPNTKKIIMPEKSFQTDAFRQMGRVINENGRGAMKMLQRFAPSLVAVPAYVLMISLLDKTTNDNEKPHGVIQNIAHKVKKHASALSVLSLMPMIALEGMNDLKGNEIAKNLFNEGKISKNLLNKVKIHNAGSFAACAVSAAAAIAAVKVALNVKNKVQEKYKAKLESKEAQKAIKAQIKAQRAEARALKQAS